MTLDNRVRGLETLETQAENVEAWATAVSTLLMFPGLVGVWPGSLTNPSGDLLDAGPAGLHLSPNNAPQINVDGLASYRNYNGSNQYHNRANQAAFDILGSESFVPAALQGLTIGGWFYFDDATPAANERFMGTFGNAAVANLAYLLQRNTSGVPSFVVGDGAATYAAGSTAVGATTWTLLVGRYTPSTSVELLSNGQVDDSNTTSIPAALLNSTADFTIGASPVPDSYLDGRAALCFLCATAVSGSFIEPFYELTRPLFGV